MECDRGKFPLLEVDGSCSIALHFTEMEGNLGADVYLHGSGASSTSGKVRQVFSARIGVLGPAATQDDCFIDLSLPRPALSDRS